MIKHTFSLLIIFCTVLFTLDGVCQPAASMVPSEEVSTLRNAMQSFAELSRDRMDAMQKELDAFKNCAERGKVYAPKGVSSDTDGCAPSGLSLGQEIPVAPPCDVIKPFPEIRFSQGALTVAKGRLIVLYSGGGSTLGRCGQSDVTRCTRTYDGEGFSACQCSEKKAPQNCGRGYGGP